MKKITNLKWSDLVSPTMSPDEYLKKNSDKIEFNYKTYEPKPEVLAKKMELLKYKGEKLNNVALVADWYPYCSRNIPRLIKIVKLLNNKNLELKIKKLNLFFLFYKSLKQFL